MNITKGKIIGSAKKVLLYGPEGIGKSTFASQFPDPLFIDTEGSTKELDIARFDAPSSWQMLLDEVHYVIANRDVCKTLVIDTIDWAERLCIEHVCASKQFSSIEDPGYGKGYTYVREEFGRLMNLLTDVIDAGVNVVLTAHAALRKFEQPDEMGAYDRWALKLIDSPKTSVSAMVKEWADMVLFANYKTIVVADAKTKKNKAQGGARVMYTTHHTCWDAKNRFGLPDEVPFEYDVIARIFADVQAAPKPASETPAAPITQTQVATEPVTEVPQADVTVYPEPEKKESPKEKKGKSGAAVTEKDLDKRIPKALRDLMLEHDVGEWDIQNVVTAKGYYPIDTDIWDYDPDFVKGVLVGAWDQVHASVKDMREKQEIPFD